MRTSVVVATAAAGFAGLAAAQFPPKQEGFTTLKSRFHENVTISYKEPRICEMDLADETQSFSGYVHLPPGFLDDVDGEKQDYPINTFFWFFAARFGAETAPLAIWLNGGPGGSSMLGLWGENGPCIVNEDSKTTDVNPWSWNNFVNILYIDEPNQVGFSFDEPTNATINLEDGTIHPADFSDGVPESNVTHKVGTFASQKPSHTTNSTAQAAHALWHFAQTWFTEFPHYKPENDKVSLWAESYGGHYGPGFMRFFQEQNEKIQNGTIDDEHAHYIHLDTLGIVNGIIDSVIQGEAYIDFPYENTFDIQVFNESIYTELKTNWTEPGGCKDQLIECQGKLGVFDVNTVNRGLVSSQEVCDHVQTECMSAAINLYNSLGHGWFDIAHPSADPFPPPYMYGYLTQGEVLGAIGSPVNFSAISTTVFEAFSSTNDIVHGGFLDAVGYLLDSGVKVHMMYGDRDYACNWIGGERASLAVPYSRQEEFASAEYDMFWTRGADNGFSGITRQLGNFSFTRVFQAGHMVPAYQPIAAYEFFMRATFDKDISSGTLPLSDDLKTGNGEAFDRWIKQPPPEFPESKCYVLQPLTCPPEVWDKVKEGKVRVEDYFVVEVYDDDDEKEEKEEGDMDEL